MLHRDKIIIEKVIREIDFATKRIEGMTSEMFRSDVDAQHSVGMAAINIGELIKHVSEELRGITPDIPWKQAAGLRDIAAHAYDTINMDDLFETAREDFPLLKEQLERLKK